MNIKGIIAIVVVMVGLFLGFNMIGNIDSTEYVVKQSFGTGELSVHQEPGWYFKNFGKVSEYDRTGTFYFSKEELDGGEGADAAALQASFNGNSTAEVSGYLKYRLPTNPTLALALHRDFKSEETVRLDLIRNQVATAIRIAGPMFTPEEAFISRRSEFTKTVRDILEQGEFLTTSEVVTRKDISSTDSNSTKTEVVTRLVLDSLGHRIITKPSVLKKYGIEIITLDIKDFDFDKETDEFIEAKKKSMSKRVASEAEAIASRQKAITEQANGEAKIAAEKATAEVAKIREVTQAQKEKEVAELNALKAKAQADSMLAVGRAEAEASKLRVQAGLSPRERAEFEMKTRIGVAEQIAKTTFPSTMIIGGGNGATNPMEAIGLRALYDLAERQGTTSK
jgi:regulator of protease activity HflC (stomatin/prohibitin superfamily)